MAGLIDPYLDEVLDYYFGAVTPLATAVPATYYVGLFVTLPNDDGSGGTEASWTDYARVAVANDLTEWPAAVSGEKSNANPIIFSAAGSGPTDLLGVGLWDDPTATGSAHLWYWNTLTASPVTVPNGGDFSMDAGAFLLDRCA